MKITYTEHFKERLVGRKLELAFENMCRLAEKDFERISLNRPVGYKHTFEWAGNRLVFAVQGPAWVAFITIYKIRKGN